jgi:hypothetical protein
MQAPRESDVQAIGQEGDEDARLDAGLELVKDRAPSDIRCAQPRQNLRETWHNWRPMASKVFF